MALENNPTLKSEYTVLQYNRTIVRKKAMYIQLK